MFEKRLQVYEAARLVIGEIVTSGKVTQELEGKYLNGIRGAKWLFDDKMVEYLDTELWEKIVDLSCAEAELNGVPNKEQNPDSLKQRSNIKKYLNRQLSEIDDRFKPFLKLRH